MTDRTNALYHLLAERLPSRRERIATAVLAKLADTNVTTDAFLIRRAVQYADALIARLDATNGQDPETDK